MSHPDPLVNARPATDEERPRAVKTLEKAAAATGWVTRATYAHGTSIGSQGQPTNLVESIVLRLRRGPLAAVATWHDGKFHTAYVWSTHTSPRRIGARDLSKFVKEQP